MVYHHLLFVKRVSKQKFDLLNFSANSPIDSPKKEINGRLQLGLFLFNFSFY